MTSPTSDIEAVASVATLYLDALHKGDVDTLRKIFADGSALHASTNGDATTLAIEPWLERVANRASPEASGYESQNRILAIDAEGTMALAKVTSTFPPKRFVDYLSLVKTSAGWCIVAKTYHASDVV